MPTLTDIVVSSDGLLDTLETALVAAGLVHFFDNPYDEYTVFAPSNTAFANVPTPLATALLTDGSWALHLLSILTMHVAEGTVTSSDLSQGQVIDTLNPNESITVDLTSGACFEPSVLGSACVVPPYVDIMASNGVAHVISEVLTPSWIGQTIPDIAGANGFNILLDLAVNCASPTIAATLTNTMGLTVFAPTDEAFTALLTELGTDRDGLCAETALLDSVLLYHVVDSVLPTSALDEGLTYVPTLLEDKFIPVTWCQDSEVLTALDSNIIATDVLATNGIIHVIDQVMLPPSEPIKYYGKGKGSGVCGKSSKGKNGSRKRRGLVRG